MKTLLFAVFCLMALVACAVPEPAPTLDIPATVTAQVNEHLASIPTATALPTYTPYPTVTPYPTPTEAATATPYPTGTPYPTATPRPTYTPYPTATPTNTPTPTPTATPVPTATPTPTPWPTPTQRPTSTPRPTATPPPAVWSSSGNWQRDSIWEDLLKDILEADSASTEYRIATLSPDPTSFDNEVYLSLGCIQGLPVAYLTPYTDEVPSWIDIYRLGMWNDRDSDWVEGRIYSYENPTLTLDRAAIYVYNTAQMRQLLGLLRYAGQNRNADIVFLAGMYSSTNEDRPGLWGKYDPAGLEDALAYLGCFRGLR